jgi:transcriptional regulator with XRE-family HTH domain
MNGFFYEHFLVKYNVGRSVFMEFSKRLKKLREDKRLSQEGLAAKLNIPRSTITNYETRPELIPRQKRLNEIADFFGVSVDYLIGRANHEELNKTEEAFLLDVEQENALSIEELMKKYNLTIDGKVASKEEIEEALRYIRFLRMK